MTLPPGQIKDLVAPFYPEVSPELITQLGRYLDLLLLWNEKMNLTAIRDPSEIVRRHFGESLFLARHLPAEAATLLDLGSGAGFPGIPVQLARPDLRITLAESQEKKSIFLREVVRTLGLRTEVWPRRAETLPPLLRFDVVALRAVDKPGAALATARARVGPNGCVAHLTTAVGASGLSLEYEGESQFLPFPRLSP